MNPNSKYVLYQGGRGHWAVYYANPKIFIRTFVFP